MCSIVSWDVTCCYYILSNFVSFYEIPAVAFLSNCAFSSPG